MVEHFTLTKVEQHLLLRLNRDVVLCVDGHPTLEAFSGEHHFDYKVFNAIGDERVKKLAFHIQGEGK